MAPHKVLSIKNVQTGHRYISITQRHPDTFLKRTLELARQGWDGRRYLRAQGPLRLVEAIEHHDAEHFAKAEAEGRTDARAPTNVWTVKVHSYHDDKETAARECARLIQKWGTDDLDRGYNRPVSAPAKARTSEEPTGDPVRPQLPDWQGERTLTEGRLTIRLRTHDLPFRAQASLANRPAQIEWPPQTAIMLEADHD